MLKGILISLTGFVVVFFMLFALYFITQLLGVLNGNKKQDEDNDESAGAPNGLEKDINNISSELNEDYYEDDIIAISAAISSLMGSSNFKVNRIQRVEPVNVLWNKERWIGMYQLGRGRHEKI